MSGAAVSTGHGFCLVAVIWLWACALGSGFRVSGFGFRVLRCAVPRGGEAEAKVGPPRSQRNGPTLPLGIALIRPLLLSCSGCMWWSIWLRETRESGLARTPNRNKQNECAKRVQNNTRARDSDAQCGAGSGNCG